MLCAATLRAPWLRERERRVRRGGEGCATGSAALPAHHALGRHGGLRNGRPVRLPAPAIAQSVRSMLLHAECQWRPRAEQYCAVVRARPAPRLWRICLSFCKRCMLTAARAALPTLGSEAPLACGAVPWPAPGGSVCGWCSSASAGSPAAMLTPCTHQVALHGIVYLLQPRMPVALPVEKRVHVQGAMVAACLVRKTKMRRAQYFHFGDACVRAVSQQAQTERPGRACEQKLSSRHRTGLCPLDLAPVSPC